MMNSLTFDQHNNKYKYTKEKLYFFIDKYNNDANDKNKYELIRFMKNYSEHNNNDFINSIEELNLKQLEIEFENVK
jgi:hypothetical protein